MELQQTLNQVNAANGDLAKAAEILAPKYGAAFFAKMLDVNVAKRADARIIKTLQAADNCVNVSNSEMFDLCKQAIQAAIFARIGTAPEKVMKFVVNNENLTDAQHKELLQISKEAYCV